MAIEFDEPSHGRPERQTRDGRGVHGIVGRKGLSVDAIGLVMDGEPGDSAAVPDDPNVDIGKGSNRNSLSLSDDQFDLDL